MGFYLAYIREPHAGEKSFTEIKQPKSYEDRTELALATQKELDISIPVLIDEMDNGVRTAYGNLPNSTYLIGTDGRVYYKQAWTNAHTLEQPIQELLKLGGKGGSHPKSFTPQTAVAEAPFGTTPSGRRLLRIPQVYPILKGAPQKEQEIAWLGSIEEALALTDGTRAPLLVEFFLPGCAFCEQSKKVVFVNPKVVELSRRFACVRLNVRDKEVSRLFDQLGFAGTPSFVFYDSAGKEVLLRRESFLEPEELIAEMYTALEKTRD